MRDANQSGPYSGPAARQPAKVLAAPPDTQVLCARQACHTTLSQFPMGMVRTEGGALEFSNAQLAAFADAHGFVRSGNEVYCSKRCHLLAERSPDGTTRVAKPIAMPDAAPADGSKLKTWESGGLAWVQCCYAVCQGRFEVPAGTDMAWRARAASAHGYVVTDIGAFCSGQCAKRMREEVAMHTKREPVAHVEQEPSRDGFVAALPEDIGSFAQYAAAIADACGGRNVKLTLSISPLSVALVEYFGDENAKSPKRRAIAWTGKTVEGACLKAVDGLASFLVGQTGAPWNVGADICKAETRTNG